MVDHAVAHGIGHVDLQHGVHMVDRMAAHVVDHVDVQKGVHMAMWTSEGVHMLAQVIDRADRAVAHVG